MTADVKIQHKPYHLKELYALTFMWSDVAGMVGLLDLSVQAPLVSKAT